jgi:hypothetical protein
MHSLLLAAALAATSSLPGWHPAPSSPFDTPAGPLCAFATHGDPIADEVQELDLTTHPDGTPARAIFAGKLILRMTNTSSGQTYDADASGSAVVDFNTDGSQHWRWVGPVLVGFRAGAANHVQGIYVLDGAYDLVISPERRLTVHGVGRETDVCAKLS